jgi:hypothetical protein
MSELIRGWKKGEELGNQAAEQSASLPGIHTGYMENRYHPWIFFIKIQ